MTDKKDVSKYFILSTHVAYAPVPMVDIKAEAERQKFLDMNIPVPEEEDEQETNADNWEPHRIGLYFSDVEMWTESEFPEYPVCVVHRKMGRMYLTISFDDFMDKHKDYINYSEEINAKTGK